MQDHRSLEHFHHESGLSPGNVVRCPHTGEQLVAVPYPGRIRRNERPYLRKQYNQCRLAQQSGLSCHVRTGQDDDLLRAVVQIHIIGHELLATRHKGLYDRMPACLYVYGITVVHLRPAVPVGQSQVGEPGQDIKTCHYTAVGLDD